MSQQKASAAGGDPKDHEPYPHDPLLDDDYPRNASNGLDRFSRNNQQQVPPNVTEHEDTVAPTHSMSQQKASAAVGDPKDHEPYPHDPLLDDDYPRNASNGLDRFSRNNQHQVPPNVTEHEDTVAPTHSMSQQNASAAVGDPKDHEPYPHDPLLDDDYPRNASNGLDRFSRNNQHQVPPNV